MLDRNEFEMYQAIGMPTNVLIGVNKYWLATKEPTEEVMDSGLTINPLLAGLVYDFAVANPTCIIESTYCQYLAERPISTLRFWYGKERIGELSIIGNKYGITSRAIIEGLYRGSYRYTKDRARVAKYMKTFVAQSIEGKLTDTVSSVSRRINAEHSPIAQDRTEKYRILCSFLESYIQDNWASISEIAMQNGASQTNLNSYVESRDAHEVASKICLNFHENKAVTVMIEGGQYVITNPKLPDGTMPINKFSVYNNSENIPERIRRNIGLLKLSTEGFVADVGYKYEANKFIVLTGDDNE
jgi:hypothetical protein